LQWRGSDIGEQFGVVKLSQTLAMTAQDPVRKPHNGAPIPNALVPLSTADQPALLKRVQLSRAINVSPRSVDNWQKKKRIPYLKITARCVRFHLPSFLAALRRFEVREAGRRA
jgi:hypothetical protein